jgi:serine/threonine-protein kinase HipA
LAGAQPKIALRRDGNQWSVPLSGAASTHILKPVTGALPTIDVVEYLTMRAAGLVGLSVAQSALATIEGIQVLISTRYDRRQEGNRVTRLHQEDLCQALAVSPEKKYQHQDGGPGVGAIAALVRSLPIREDQESVARHFFEALVFNTLAACTDAHAKNYSLLLEGQSVRLAPLYDLASAVGYWDGESRINLAMSIGGHYALNHITLSDLVREGSRLGLEDAWGIVEHIRGQIIPAFDAAREELVSLRPDAQVLADRLMGALAGLPLLATDR